MAKQNFKFITDAEISEIMITAFSADIEIYGDSEKFIAEYPEGTFSVEEKKGKINVKRKKKALPALGKIKLVLRVPQSCVPDLKVAVKKCTFAVNGGIYGDISFYGEHAKINFNGATANIILTKGGGLHAEYDLTTVKNAFLWNAKTGDILGKESFFSRIDIDLKSGNVGLWETDFLLGEVKVKNGNIQAMLKGSEGDYKTLLTAKNGTCNRESGGSGEKSLKFYAAYGNIIVDYDKKEIKNDADDDVAENSGGESGT